MNKINVLVTGGAGYIGSQVCKHLHSSNFSPITFDNLSSGNQSFVKWGPLIKADILNTEKIIETIKIYKPKAIIHFAAKSIVEESQKNLDMYMKVNVDGTKSILSAMKQTGLNKIIYSSTAAVYGNKYKTDITEDFPENPINNYGTTKLLSEKIIKDSYKNLSIDSIVLRYFNASGCDHEEGIGEMHDPETHLIPNITQNMIKGEVSNIYGNDFDTKDGTCIRDFIHVKDLASAHVLALKHILNNKISDTFNLGTGKGHSVQDVINTYEEIFSKNCKIKISNRRDGDPASLVANVEKFKKTFNWDTQHSSLHNIIDSDIKWRLSIKT